MEFLRIISMLFIIAHHLAEYGFDWLNMPFSLPKIWVDFLAMGGKTGVPVFILISGYFMCRSNFTFRKFLKIMGTVWFYHLAFLAYFTWIVPSPVVKPLNLICDFVPLLLNTYWFIAQYLLLMLFSPFLNLLIEKMSREQFRHLLFFLLIPVSVLPTLILFHQFKMGTFAWFCTLYLIAGYYRKYPVKQGAVRHHISLAAGGAAALLLFVVLFDWFGTYFENPVLKIISSLQMRTESNLFYLVISVELFLGGLSIQPFYSRFLNILASSALGVYLLHEHYIFNPYLWKGLVKVSRYKEYPVIIFYSAAVIAVIYFSCAAVELIRLYTVEKVWLMLIDRFFPAAGKWHLRLPGEKSSENP